MMKKTVLGLGILLNFACTKQSNTQTAPKEPTTPIVINGENCTLETTNFDFRIPGIKTSPFGFGSQLSQAVSCTILYSVNGIRHIISNPSDLTPTPPIHLIYKNSNWQLEGYYPTAAMDLFRNYEKIDENGTFAIANHGNETDTPRPYGDLFVVKTNGEKLEWTKVSKFKGFYHSVGAGDLNSDGLTDIVGLNMGSYSDWYDNLHTSLQNNNGLYDEARNLISYDRWEGKGNHGAGAVFVLDIVGDKRPEIIRADYGFNPSFPAPRYSFAILKYDDTTKKFEFYSTPKELGVFVNLDRGATSIKAIDVEKDGDLDLAIATEGNNFHGIQIWLNDGKGDFSPGQEMGWAFDNFSDFDSELWFREFEIADIDKDSDIDILLSGYQYKNGVSLENSILINTNGTFKPYNKPIFMPNIQPGFVKGVIFDGKLHFIGFEDLHTNNAAENRFKLHDITVTL